ncbi:hypothetical protein CN909_15005 [Bacillus cereus]|nr:hypothetical protein CN909_15005 [Bacillus cereus]
MSVCDTCIYFYLILLFPANSSISIPRIVLSDVCELVEQFYQTFDVLIVLSDKALFLLVSRFLETYNEVIKLPIYGIWRF